MNIWKALNFPIILCMRDFALYLEFEKADAFIEMNAYNLEPK